MPKFKVYYRTNPDFMEHQGLKLSDVLEGDMFAFIKVTDARDINDLYMKMQGEVWSPHNEARGVIEAAGVKHTSMSVGDVAIDDSGVGWQVAMIGWKQVES